MPSDFVNQTCTGLKVSGCYGEIYKIWKDTVTGSLTVAVTGRSQYSVFSLKNDRWMPESVESGTANLIAKSKQLNDGSYWHYDIGNNRILLSKDLKNWSAMTLPTSSQSYKKITAFSIDDIWILGKQVQHWNGQEWSQVGAVSNPERVVKTAAGKYLVYSDFGTHSYQNGCWQSWKTSNLRFFTIGSVTGVFSGNEFKVVDPGFVPEY